MRFNVTINGKVFEVEVERAPGAPMGVAYATPAAAPAPMPAAPMQAAPMPAPAPAPVAAAPAPAPAAAPAAGTETVCSPMPGSVFKMNVNVGDTVSAGQVLLILEAMKMENEIPAPRAGKVIQIVAPQGTTVETGAPLVVLG